MNGNERVFAREFWWAGYVGAYAAIVDVMLNEGEGGDVCVVWVILMNIDVLMYMKVWVRVFGVSGDAATDEDAYARWRTTDEACGRRLNVYVLFYVVVVLIGCEWWERWIGECVGVCVLSV